ncbi:MAG TPA: flavin reductase family protein [Methanocella sp.]|nr:flavin reductase family protein [Methanocella sp.]
MSKISAGTNVFTYPMPVVLVGTQANGKANFMAEGWVSRANINPPMATVAIGKSHYTPQHIIKNRTFSICTPTAKQLEKVDYCGIASGKNTDKSGVFKVFYGDLKTAPMIEDCPLCIECKLVQTIDLPTHYIFVGEIVASYAEELSLSNGRPDMKKINPLLLTMPDNTYWALGAQAGRAWNDGKKLMKHPSI